MISVIVKLTNNEINSLEVSGHANYANIGKDIVCAGVSSIIVGGINALEDYKDNIKIINANDVLGVEIKQSNQNIQIILKTILIQLETIQDSYGKYIKIKKINGGVWYVIKIKFTTFCF